MSVDVEISEPAAKPSLGVALPNYEANLRVLDPALDAKTGSRLDLARRDGSKNAKPTLDYHALLAAQSAEWHREQYLQLLLSQAVADGAEARKAKEGGATRG